MNIAPYDNNTSPFPSSTIIYGTLPNARLRTDTFTSLHKNRAMLYSCTCANTQICCWQRNPLHVNVYSIIIQTAARFPLSLYSQVFGVQLIVTVTEILHGLIILLGHEQHGLEEEATLTNGQQRTQDTQYMYKYS